MTSITCDTSGILQIQLPNRDTVYTVQMRNPFLKFNCYFSEGLMDFRE